MIQKEIYFYWGNQSLSFLRYMTIKSFSFFNPEWQINLIYNSQPASNKWLSSEEQDNTNYRGIDYRKNLEQIEKLKLIDLKTVFPLNYSTMSNVHIKDILNWYLLSTKSCVVADMDIVFCKPMESSSAFDFDAHVNICNYDFYHNYMPVSFMISNVSENGKNRFYNQVFQRSIVNYNPAIYESCGTNCIPYKSIYEITEAFKDMKINKMDHMSVFPFVNPDPSSVSDRCWLGDYSHLFDNNTIGVHWYGGQPRSQSFNNQMTLSNFKTFNNTISNIIKKIT